MQLNCRKKLTRILQLIHHSAMLKLQANILYQMFHNYKEKFYSHHLSYLTSIKKECAACQVLKNEIVNACSWLVNCRILHKMKWKSHIGCWTIVQSYIWKIKSITSFITFLNNAFMGSYFV